MFACVELEILRWTVAALATQERFHAEKLARLRVSLRRTRARMTANAENLIRRDDELVGVRADRLTRLFDSAQLQPTAISRKLSIAPHEHASRNDVPRNVGGFVEKNLKLHLVFFEMSSPLLELANQVAQLQQHYKALIKECADMRIMLVSCEHQCRVCCGRYKNIDPGRQKEEQKRQAKHRCAY